MVQEGPATLTVREAAAYLHIGKNLCWLMVWEGKLPVIRFGRRVLIPKAALDKMLAEAQPQPVAGR